MERESVIATLRAHEPELRASGIESLALFGSVARGDDHSASDIDVVITLTEQAAQGGFAYYARLDRLRYRLVGILGRTVDVVAKPIRNDSLRSAIDRESTIAF